MVYKVEIPKVLLKKSTAFQKEQIKFIQVLFN